VGSGPGHIELERTLDSIIIGRRHRKELGDIDALASSIEREGLLQPPTLTPDGVLVCGARRYAALRKLGRKTVNVWVRSGISDRLGQLMAEQDDNVLHKPLTQTEAAALYRELKAVMAEDAARRQEASRFTAKGQNRRSDGGAESTPPSPDAAGRAREQAARMVTGRASYTKLEQVGRLQQLAADPTQPETVRAQAAAELDRIDAGAPVHPAHQRMAAHLSLAELERLAGDESQPARVRERAAAEAARVHAAADAELRAVELERLAAAALDRVRTAGKRRTRTATPAPGPVVDDTPARYSLRAFVLTWEELAGWWTHYDADEVGPALTDEQWERFEATVAATLRFTETARTARAESTAAFRASA